MAIDWCALVFKATECGSENETPYSSYEDIGVFSLLLTVLRPVLALFVRLRLLPRCELEHPGFGVQVGDLFLMTALHLILKVRIADPFCAHWAGIAVNALHDGRSAFGSFAGVRRNLPAWPSSKHENLSAALRR